MKLRMRDGWVVNLCRIDECRDSDGHDINHEPSAGPFKRNSVAKKQGVVHGPSTRPGMPWYVMVSPDLAWELGVLGRSFKIHR